jgi:hypothetical protein
MAQGGEATFGAGAMPPFVRRSPGVGTWLRVDGVGNLPRRIGTRKIDAPKRAAGGFHLFLRRHYPDHRS